MGFLAGLRWRGVLGAVALLLSVGLVASPAGAASQRRDAKAKSVSPVKKSKASTAARKPPAKAAAARVTGKLSARSIPKSRSARAARRAATVVVARPSFGELSGLRATIDPLSLRSSVALVMDQDTHEILLDKNARAVLPIASLTKLMTSVVVVEAGLPLDEVLTISQADLDTEKGSGSRLAVGTQLTRGEMLHLALMSSENRAANALGRHYPGGLPAFVQAMNAKASLLGMDATHYVEPTGLSSRNQSSASDLARLVGAAYDHPLIRELSISQEHEVAVGHRMLQYRNTNGLVRNPAWEIGLQKTGYISEAGRCLVMQAQLAGRKLIMVFLDSTGKYSRQGDAERVRSWIESTVQAVTTVPGDTSTPSSNGILMPNPPLNVPALPTRGDLPKLTS